MVDLNSALKDFIGEGQPLVSIIIPCFNKESTIKETVESALAQDYSNTEIVIANDASTDGSAAVLQGIVSANPGKKISVHDKPHGGVADTRNFGIAKSEGRIVLCLDADDTVDPTFISKAMQAMRKGAHIVCSNLELFGDKSAEWTPPNYDRYGIRYNNLIPSLAIYDRTIWMRLGGYNRSFPFDEQWNFYMNATRLPILVARINEKLSRHRVTSDSLASTYLKDAGPLSVALQITANPGFYAVEQALWAHEQLSKMPDNWIEAIKKQSELHPREWLPKFWLGLTEEHRSNYQGAVDLYQAAHQLNQRNHFQPLFRLGLILERAKQIENALDSFHMVRVDRPDMERFVKDHLENLVKQQKETAGKASIV